MSSEKGTRAAATRPVWKGLFRKVTGRLTIRLST